MGRAAALVAVAMIILGCSRPTFVNIGKSPTGADIGVPKADVEQYAARHRISFQEASRRMAAEMAKP